VLLRRVEVSEWEIATSDNPTATFNVWQDHGAGEDRRPGRHRAAGGDRRPGRHRAAGGCRERMLKARHSLVRTQRITASYYYCTCICKSFVWMIL